MGRRARGRLAGASVHAAAVGGPANSFKRLYQFVNRKWLGQKRDATGVQRRLVDGRAVIARSCK